MVRHSKSVRMPIYRTMPDVSLRYFPSSASSVLSLCPGKNTYVLRVIFLSIWQGLRHAESPGISRVFHYNSHHTNARVMHLIYAVCLVAIHFTFHVFTRRIINE